MKTTLPLCFVAIVAFYTLPAGAQLPDIYNPYTGNPLSQAQGYNVITKNNFTAKGGQIQGPVAMGGDLFLNGDAGIATGHSGYYPTTRNNDDDNYSLVVGGKVVFTGGGHSTLNKGFIRLANTTGARLFDTDCNGNAVTLRVKPSEGASCDVDFGDARGVELQRQQTAASATAAHGLNFTAAYTWFTQLSNAISYHGITTAPIAEVVKSTVREGLDPQIILVPNKINFIQLSATQLTNLAGQGTLTFSTSPSPSTPVVFNITVPDGYTWTPPTFAGLADSANHYMVWHLASATGEFNLTIAGSNTVPGTVMVPTAHVAKTGRNAINGQLIANSVIMEAGTVAYYPFLGSMAAFSPSLLPVKLAAFNGVIAGNKATLRWSVTQNEESASFDIEKSTDSRTFTSIAHVQSTGKTGAENYVYADASGSFGYYRLKMVSKNGHTAYSGIIKLQTAAGTILQADLLQNPVTTSLPLRLTVDRASAATVQLYTLTGAKLFTRNITVQKGSTNFTLAFDQDLAKGLYLLEVVANGERRVVKVTK